MISVVPEHSLKPLDLELVRVQLRKAFERAQHQLAQTQLLLLGWRLR